MVYNGWSERKGRASVRIIRCAGCGSSRMEEPDIDPLARQLKDRDILLSILKDLAGGKSIRETASDNSSAPGTVVKTEKKMEDFLKEKFDAVAKETGLSPQEIVNFYNHCLEKKAKN